MTGFKRALRGLLGTSAPLPAAVADPATRELFPPLPSRPNARISDMALAEANTSYGEPLNPWTLPDLPPFAAKAAKAQMAMDGGGGAGNNYVWASQGLFSEGLGFLGYAYLGELTQRPEYRRVSEIFAAETTRKWIKLSGDPDRVADIEAALKKHDVRAHMRRVVELDGFFGRGQIYIDLGDEANSEELQSPLVPAAKVTKGGIKAFRVVEPFWSYPGTYDTRNPLDPDFYKPRFWYVMAGQVDASRLITIVGREMPDMLKPAYSFGGLSLSQMIKPYVDNWLRTRQSVSDMLHSFSTMVLSTDISTVLSAGPATGLLARIKLFNATRDNRGLMVLNKDTEELSNVSAPLGTLDKLQSQSQEQIASACGIPLVVLLGVTPSGLNASSDGEMRSFYDNVKSYQERAMRTPLHRILDLIQLDLDGKIDPEIGFDFEDLWEMSETDRATVRKTNADIDSIYVGVGVVDNDEVRTRITQDEESPYFGMKLQGNDELNAPPPSPAELAAAKGEDNPDANAPPGTPKKAVTTAPNSKQAADVWTFNPTDLFGLAMDGQHWITVHPNGDDETGHPVLISGSASTGYTIIGGAGGKLNGTSVSPGSMSAARADHHDASHAAHAASKHAHKEGTSEAHEAAAAAHGHAKAAKDKAGLTKEGDEHGRSLAEHKQLAREAGGSSPDDKAKGEELAKAAHEATGRADAKGTVDGHDEAAGAHLAAAAHHIKLGNNHRAKAHATKADEHTAKAQELEESGKADHKAKADELSKTASKASVHAGKDQTIEAHEKASAAHIEAAGAHAAAGDMAKAGRHTEQAISHTRLANNLRNGPPPSPADKEKLDKSRGATAHANALTEKANASGTEDDHAAAAIAHASARYYAREAGLDDVASEHANGYAHHNAASTAAKNKAGESGGDSLSRAAEDASKRAGELNTPEAHDEAGRAHLKAYKEGPNETARAHYNEYVKHFNISLQLRKKAANSARQNTHLTPEVKERVAHIEKRYAGKSHAEIEKDLSSRFGLRLMGDHTRHEKAYGDAYSAHNEKVSFGGYATPEEQNTGYSEVNRLREVARRAQVGRVRSVTTHDLSSTTASGKKNAIEARKTFGHVSAAMEHLEKQGYDLKSLFAKYPVAVVPASAGKNSGVSWQNKGQGHLVVSSNKVNDTFLADMASNAAKRKEAGRNRWGVSDAAPTDQYHVFTAIHELAHAVGMQPGNGSIQRLQATLQRMHPNPTERRAWFAKNVSDYGSSNMHEMDAELAAMVAGPGYQRGTLPKELEDHVDTLFGKHAA